jgi:hypothetical protein
MDSASRQKILAVFERHRQMPGAPFDESHFVDFLIASPKAKHAVHDSFAGLRRFNAFIDEVQYEFAVCFSLKDRDADYSLAQFVERIEELQNSRRGSLASLSNQERAGAGWNVVVVVDFILVLAGIAVRDHPWVFALVLLVAFVVNVGFFVRARKAGAYLRRLRARIEQNVAVQHRAAEGRS